MKPFISTSTYGILNYVMAIALMSSPWVFGFHQLGGAALFLPLIFGWLQLIMAIFSRHKFGIFNVFPVPMHCFIDVIGGSFVMASPFVYGFASAHGVFWPHVIIGGIVFCMGIFTQTSPFTDEPHHVFKDGLIGNTSDVDEPMSH
jgi:uncharacterized membrane protein YedE/YeeE